MHGASVRDVAAVLEEWLAEIEELEYAMLEESGPRLRMRASAAAGV